jgi:hypothetical protein
MHHHLYITSTFRAVDRLVQLEGSCIISPSPPHLSGRGPRCDACARAPWWSGRVAPGSQAGARVGAW